MSADRCDLEILEKGKTICVFHASQAVTEPWVQSVAKKSGQRVDWGYAAGWVHVNYIGSRFRVRLAIMMLKSKLVAAAKKCPRGWGMTGFRFVKEQK